MDELISTFHIDTKLLIAQVINFAIVFVILYYFAIKPLIKILQERSKKVEDSLTNAEKIEEELEKTKKKREEIVRNAKQEANELMTQAEQRTEERKKELMIKTKEEIEGIINKTKLDLQKEKVATIQEIKKEAGELVVAAAEKVLSEKMDGEVDKQYVKRVIKDVSK